MPLRRVSPEEAKALIDEQGYVYVDVRSTPEFAAGHPEGAYNVPLLEIGPAGMAPNPDFIDVMQRLFSKESKLVVGCKAGGRSLRAASMLEAAGFADVVDQRAGFDGGPSPSGAFEAGWRPKGLPVSREALRERTYSGILEKLR